MLPASLFKLAADLLRYVEFRVFWDFLRIVNPIGSMYGIFTYIYHKNQPNVGKYTIQTIHGSYGNCILGRFETSWVLNISRIDPRPSMQFLVTSKGCIQCEFGGIHTRSCGRATRTTSSVSLSTDQQFNLCISLQFVHELWRVGRTAWDLWNVDPCLSMLS